MHKETVFGKRSTPSGAEAFHVRKPIESITTKKQIDKIVDPVIRKIITGRIEFLGGYVKGDTVPPEAFFGTDVEGLKVPRIFLPNRNGDPVPVKKVRIRENLGGAERLKDINQYVNPRNNHHVLIYRGSDDSFKEKTVTFWTAVERKKHGMPVVQLPEDGIEVIATLQINDKFLIGLSKEMLTEVGDDLECLQKHLYRVQKLSEGDYTFRLHTASTLNHPEQEFRIQSLKKWREFNPVPVKITPAGELIIRRMLNL